MSTLLIVVKLIPAPHYTWLHTFNWPTITAYHVSNTILNYNGLSGLN